VNERKSSSATGTTKTQKPIKGAAGINLSDHCWYLNRELTWLGFNQRVLHEAEDERTPLLERLKFIAIVSANLDEFFMEPV
jgi:polyphosphate kinase